MFFGHSICVLYEKYETYLEAPMILKRDTASKWLILGDVTVKLWNAMVKLDDMNSYLNLSSFGWKPYEKGLVS